MTDFKLSYSHSFNLNDILGNLNCLGIHAYCMIIVLYYSLFIDYIELLLPLHHHFANFMLNCLNSCETMFLVPRTLLQVNMVSELMVG